MYSSGSIKVDKCILPLSVPMGFYKRDTKDKKGNLKNKIGDPKKPFRLNLNNWRNANKFLRTAADVNFRELVSEQFTNLKPYNKLGLVYVLFVGDKRLKDVANITMVLDKFFCDALTGNGMIEDDNYLHIPAIIHLFGGYEKGNERCEVHLIGYEDNKEFATEVAKIIQEELDE